MCVRLPGDMLYTVNNCTSQLGPIPWIFLCWHTLYLLLHCVYLQCPFHLVYVSNANRVDGYDGVLNPTSAPIENLVKLFENIYTCGFTLGGLKRQ